MVFLIASINFIACTDSKESGGWVTLTSETSGYGQYNFEVEDERPIFLKIESHLTRGHIKWHLDDPDGKTILSGRIQSTNIKDTIELSPKKGKWQLIIDPENAVGDYNIKWYQDL